MKFLCIGCDEVMRYEERRLPGDGTMGVVFVCGRCGSEIAMLTNPMETQVVSSLGIKIGGRTVPEQPLEITRTFMVGGDENAIAESPPRRGVRWSDEASDRLGRVPGFVRGMVKRIYADYASERGIPEITPAVMDRARAELGLEDM